MTEKFAFVWPASACTVSAFFFSPHWYANTRISFFRGEADVQGYITFAEKREYFAFKTRLGLNILHTSQWVSPTGKVNVTSNVGQRSD